MVLGRTKAHEVEEVPMVIQSQVDSKLPRHICKGLVRDKVVPPVSGLPLALVPDSIELLWVDIVPLEQLKDACQQRLWITWVFVESSPESIEDNVLVLRRLL